MPTDVSVVIWPADDPKDATTIPGAGLSDTHTVVIDGLEANTAYVFEIMGTDSNGDTVSLSGPESIATLSTEAAAVADAAPPAFDGAILAEDVTRHEARISWASDKLTGGRVSYGLDADEPTMTALSPHDLSREHELLLVALEAETTYQYRVEMVDSAANSAWSEIQRFTTLAMDAVEGEPGAEGEGETEGEGEDTLEGETDGDPAGDCGEGFEIIGAFALLLLLMPGRVRRTVA